MLAAAKAVEVIGVELAATAFVRVERARVVLCLSVSGTLTRSNSGGDVVFGESSSKTVVPASIVLRRKGVDGRRRWHASELGSIDGSAAASGVERAVGCRRWLFWRLEIMRAAPDFAGERQTVCPCRRLEQDGEEVCLRDRPDRTSATTSSWTVSTIGMPRASNRSIAAASKSRAVPCTTFSTKVPNQPR